MENQHFMDALIQKKGEDTTFCYRSGLLVYEEVFHAGQLTAAGWNASGYPLDVLSNCPTRLNVDRFARPWAFGLEAGGRSAVFGFTLAEPSCERQENRLIVRVPLENKALSLRIIVVTELDGTPFFTRYLEITNLSAAPMPLSHLAVLAGGVEVQSAGMQFTTYEHEPERLYRLGYMENSSGCREGDFSWHALHPDKTSFGGRFSRERHRFPAAFLESRASGVMFAFQMAWSGGFDFSFDLDAHPEQDESRLSMSLAMDSFEPSIVLAPGEGYTTPQVYAGAVHGSLDDSVNGMNAHLRRSVLPNTSVSAACTVGSGMGPEHDMSVKTSKRFIDQMADIGCEVFIVDAGWYCPPDKESEWHLRAGDWHPDTQRYPNGLEEVRDYCHEKGMKFGLWMEGERVGGLSAVRHEHPEWLIRHPDGQLSDGVLDLTNPNAAAWAENEISRVITECKLDLFRIDYNVSRWEPFGLIDKNGPECAAARHIDAVYKMYRSLKKRFPQVIFENCAGGGGRCDTGMLRAFDHSWVSDNQVAPRSVMITNGMSLVLPPERMDRLVAGMGCHQLGSLQLHLRNAMFGHLTMNVLSPATAEWNPEQMELVRHSLSLYKEFIRPILPEARVYHHTPETRTYRENDFVVLELASSDRTRGMVGIFSPAIPQKEAVVVCPRGLSAAKRYRVTLDNSGDSFLMTGARLQNEGLRVYLPAALSSELILLQAEE